MRKRIIPYPRLTSMAGLQNLGVTITWEFSDGMRDLPYEEISTGRYRIIDKLWYPDQNQLSIRFKVEIKNPLRLFSGIHGNNGCEVADQSSTLGCALRWRLPRTNLQGASHCRDIVSGSTGTLQFSGSISFPPKAIRFALDVEFVLYLKDANEEKFGIYAKNCGSILGSIGGFVLETGGSGGYFPTVTEEVVGGPAWKVFANITCAEDFDEDFESDYFHLSLNKLHPLYEKLYVTSRQGKIFVSPLLFEAFVNACVILIRRACQYIPDRSWVLTANEKDEQTIYVNFKALLRACLPAEEKKSICAMELEELFLAVRMGLARHINIDMEEPTK